MMQTVRNEICNSKLNHCSEIVIKFDSQGQIGPMGNEKILPPFRPKRPIVVFRKSLFSLEISKSTIWIAVKFYRTSVYHYKVFTCRI